MNKFGVVLGIATVATLAGCKDPDFKHGGSAAVQNEVKNVETVEAQPAAIEQPVAGEPVAPKATEEKPAVTASLSKPAEPEYTIYIVQNGDYLAKISKKFNVTIASIKRLNPSIKKDVVRVGQKLKLPGKIDIPPSAVASSGAASGAAVAAKKPVAKKRSYAPYAGATKEYVVKNGDTLGSIAYGNGINIRQLKELNGLTSDSLKIGQKLKIPAEKVVKAEKAKPAEKKVAAVAPAAAPAVEKKAEETAPAAAPAAPAAEATDAEAAAAPAAAATEAAAPAKADAATAATYVVQEGDDMTGVSIRWGVSAAQIRELNNLAEGDQLVPGQIIKLPADAQQ